MGQARPEILWPAACLHLDQDALARLLFHQVTGQHLEKVIPLFMSAWKAPLKLSQEL